MASKHLVLTPAYGRDYRSKKDLMEDWNKNKDFILANVTHRFCGQPVNKADIEKHEAPCTVELRYKKLQRLHVVKVESSAQDTG